MAVPKTTVWTIDPHTKAKHAILDGYLKAWFAILGKKWEELLYVDGFCGPGRYEGGEPGSPLVAFAAAKSNLNAGHISGKVKFWFIEQDKSRVENLRAELRQDTNLTSFDIHVEQGEFEEAFGHELSRIEEGPVPAFVFIDPFGFEGIPYSIVRRLLSLPSTEVFINIMIDSINRFLDHPHDSIRKHIVRVFGTEECLQIARQGGPRVDALRKLYQRQLEAAAKFVRPFEMRDRQDRTLYYLFFASNNALGHTKMKKAMWDVDRESGAFFSDAYDPDQGYLFKNEGERNRALKTAIVSRFGDRDKVQVSEVKEFVEDHTAFLASHMRAALKDLEDLGKLRVEEKKADGNTRKKGYFPDEAVLSFRNVQAVLF